jgi:hypothetical protein
MSEIHKLTDRLLPGEPDSELVEALRDLLARAERGEISGLAWAACTPNDDAFSGWQGAGGTTFALGASIMALQTRFALMMMDPEE